MPRLHRVVLDVLKPRRPSALDLAMAIAGIGPDYRVELAVDEIDENTVTTSIQIQAESVDLDRVKAVIQEMGGAVHSIDRVEAWGDGPARED